MNKNLFLILFLFQLLIFVGTAQAEIIRLNCEFNFSIDFENKLQRISGADFIEIGLLEDNIAKLSLNNGDITTGEYSNAIIIADVVTKMETTPPSSQVEHLNINRFTGAYVKKSM